MKKIYTQLFLCLFVFASAYSQIPNPSFETWQAYSGTSILGSPINGEYPTGWQTSDSTLQYYTGPHSAVKESTTTCDASASVKLTSVTVASNIVPGAATNGKITGVTLSSIIGGSPFTTRAAKLTGCYKYVPTGADSGLISAVLVKWNGSARDTIALSSTVVYANGGLTNFNFDFVYRSPNSPDTILIVLASGTAANQTQVGSYLIVDNIGTNGIIGIDENSLIKNVHVFPQPAQNELNIQVQLNQNISLKYEIADITGRKIISGKMTSASEKVDISILSRGNYFIALRNDENAVLYTSKFIVSK